MTKILIKIFVTAGILEMMILLTGKKTRSQMREGFWYYLSIMTFPHYSQTYPRKEICNFHQVSSTTLSRKLISAIYLHLEITRPKLAVSW